MVKIGIIDDVIATVDALKFKDTVFYKEDSDLQNQYNALKKLNEEYPNNENLINKLYMIKKGLDGENEISYQLKNAHIGMYVLRDVKVKYEDLTAQIDYVIITPIYTYFVECKNLVGNITVTEKGDFIREFEINGKKIKKGIYSPLRQVEAQREVIRKIWESHTSKIRQLFASKNFEHYRRVLVVAANQDTILNTSKAPENMKHKILRADALIRQIEYDIEHRNSDDRAYSKKEMEALAKSYMDNIIDDEVDYYELYKEQYCNQQQSDHNALKNELIRLRKDRAEKLNIPAYYVFTNEELDKLVEVRPKTVEELRNSNILPPIKVKTHGVQIITEINKFE